MEAVQNDYQNTVLGKIPADWKLVKLGEIVDFYNSKRKPVKENKRKPGIYPYYGASGIIDYVDDYIFEGDYILLAEDGANILTRSTPIAFRISGKTWVNNHAHVLKPKLETDINYLTYYLESINYEKYNSGTAQPKLNRKVCETIDIAFPSIREREEIGEILSTWDKAIELKEKLIEQKKKQKKGLMQKLLTGEVRLPGFKGEWKKVRLGKIGETYNGLSGKSAKDFGEGRPYIPYKTIFDDAKIDLTKLDYVRIESGENQNSAKYGDIFFTTSSETPDEVAMSSILLDDVGEVYLNSFCFGYRLNNFSDLLPEFAQFIFRGDDFRKKTLRLAQGSTRFNISKNEVMKIEVSLPSIEEQESIAAVLSNSDKEIKLLHKQVELLKQQKKGLMQLLLTGKVRVKV